MINIGSERMLIEPRAIPSFIQDFQGDWPVPVAGYQHMKTKGYLIVQGAPWFKNYPFEQTLSNADSDYTEFCHTQQTLFNPTHLPPKTSWKTLFQGMGKYDHAQFDPTHIDLASVAYADYAMRQKFSYLLGKTDVVSDPSDLEINFEKSAGMLGKLQDPPCKSHGEFFARFGDEIRDYWMRDFRDVPIVLWQAFGKNDEIIKEKKWNNNDQRNIISAPTDYFVFGKRLFEEQNKRLDYKNDPWSMIGIDKSHGKLAYMLNHCAKDAVLCEEGDVQQWDSRFHVYLMNKVRDLRKEFYSPYARYAYPDLDERVDYYYRQITQAYVCLPNGQVVLKEDGQNSGQVNTTYDNQLGHEWITCYLWSKLFSSECTHENFSKMMTTMFPRIYGDDYLRFWRTSHHIEKQRISDVYSELGMILPLDRVKIFRQNHIENLSFLGNEFHNIKSKWVWYFDEGKALSTLGFCPPMSPLEKIKRVGQILFEVGCTPRLNQHVLKYRQFLIDKYSHILTKSDRENLLLTANLDVVFAVQSGEE